MCCTHHVLHYNMCAVQVAMQVLVIHKVRYYKKVQESETVGLGVGLSMVSRVKSRHGIMTVAPPLGPSPCEDGWGSVDMRKGMETSQVHESEK